MLGLSRPGRSRGRFRLNWWAEECISPQLCRVKLTPTLCQFLRFRFETILGATTQHRIPNRTYQVSWAEGFLGSSQKKRCTKQIKTRVQEIKSNNASTQAVTPTKIKEQTNKQTNKPTNKQTNNENKQANRQTNKPPNKPTNQQTKEYNNETTKPTNQKKHKPKNYHTNKPTDQQQALWPTDPPSNQPTQPINQPTHQATKQPSHQATKPPSDPTTWRLFLESEKQNFPPF